jgi:molybdopterin-guanine dinucleotide biosynthesis protein A
VSRLAGVVLAGGAGRRLGGADKAALLARDGRLIDLVVRQLARIADPVVVARGPLPLLPALETVQVADDGEGPLGGLLAGLDHVATVAPEVRTAAVVAVDSPGIDVDVLLHLVGALGAADVALAVVGDRPQPLHAVWSVAVRTRVRERLAAGERRVLDLLEELLVVRVDVPTLTAAGLGTRFARDVDTPDDLAAAELRIDDRG